MITHEVEAEGFSPLTSSDSWEKPDALISTAKQEAHDGFFLDTPDGEWLSPGRIAHEVHQATSVFVGETPLGRQVFLVAPGERTRPINQNNIPLDAHFAYVDALETEYSRAVQNAEDQHLITHEDAVRQEGHMDSGAARVLRKPFRNQNQDAIRDGALAASQAAHMAIPAGIVGAGIALAARKKDGQGRLFRNVGKVMYGTSAGVTVGSLILSACTSVQSLPSQEVAITMMSEQFSPTVDQATQAVASWVGIRVPLAEGEYGIFPTQAIFEVDQTDSTGQKLKTLSLLNPDGRTTDPDLRYAMGLALIPSEKTGETVDLPFLVQLGENGEALMLGMFLDPAQSTKEVGVFRLNIIKDSQIRPVTQEVVVTKVAGGVTIELRDISDPNNTVIYHLVSTPKDVSSPSQQSAVPSQVPDNNWIDKVVAFMSGAGSVQAAEPATPDQLASVTPLPPPETPEPAATPNPVESFEIPATHAPWWGFDGRVGKLLTTQNERDFALYGAYFQPYLVNQHIETIGGQEVVVAEAVYQGPDGVKKNVDVIFDSQMLAFVNWSSTGTPKPIMGVGEEVIPINKIKVEVQAWIDNKIQVPLYVVIGYGGIPSNIHDRNCDNICGVVDDVLLQMDPDDLLEFYRNGGVGFQDAGREVRLLVEFVANGQGNLRQEAEISPWPADQIRQFPFNP